MSGYVIYQYSGSATNLNIYTTLDGKRVTEINSYEPFNYGNPITHVTGDSILKIRDGYDDGGFYQGAFTRCSNLTTANFQTCSYIGSWAFNNCEDLSSINFPNCNYISEGAFYSCSSLTSVSFPKCSFIGGRAFKGTPFQNNQITASGYAELNCVNGNKFLLNVSSASRFTSFNGDHTFICDDAFFWCTSLTSVNFSNCSYIGGTTFLSCTALTSISFPRCSYIGTNAFVNTPFQNNQITASGYAEYQNSINKFLLQVSSTSGFTSFTGDYTFICGDAFNNCSSLTTVSFPSCSYIGDGAFNSCASLASISLPECTYIGSSAFWMGYNLSNNSLSFISLPKCSYIGGGAFFGCSSLTSIYLMSTSVCTLNNYWATFSNTGIWSNKGSIIVPASLVSSYQAASEWSYFSNRIFGA